MGQIDQAIERHKEAIELAKTRNLKELEGEQHCLIAMAYLELQDLSNAKTSCEQAITVFNNANLESDLKKAQELFMTINSAMT